MTAAVTEIRSATELNHTGARSSSHGVGIESYLDAAKEYSTCLIRTTHITQLFPDLFRRSREPSRAVSCSRSWRTSLAARMRVATTNRVTQSTKSLSTDVASTRIFGFPVFPAG